MMPHSPSIVPSSDDHDIYLVFDDLSGRLGRIWREANEKDTDRATLIQYLLEGQYSNPARVFAFNTDEGLARDASARLLASFGSAWLATMRCRPRSPTSSRAMPAQAAAVSLNC